ncbi:MAG: hypothetical protein PUB53_06530 [Bacteroidales bacterium]|nr:hypothetical protein [Bacteroidales bacterium]
MKLAEGFCFQTLQEGSAVQAAFSGYALFEPSWFMTHKSRLRRDNPPSRHDWPSLSFSFIFARDSPCEETVCAYCLQAFKALGEQASCLLFSLKQAGCLLSQCTVACNRMNIYDHSRTIRGNLRSPKLKGWLKGLKGLKTKPFSQFPSENQRE